MEQKTFLEYATVVMYRAFCKAWDKFGALGTLLGLMVSIAVAYFAEQPKSLKDFGSSDAIMAAQVFLLLFICAMGFYILREPVIIHNEQQVSKENLEREIKRLNEETKPKLELKIDANELSYSYMKPHAFIFHIHVTNTATMESIEGVEINLVKVGVNPQTYVLPAKLSIMYNHENRLNAGDSLYVGIVEIKAPSPDFGETQYQFKFTLDNNKSIHNVPRVFDPPLEFTIRASGINTSPVETTFELFSSNENNETIIKLREVNND